MTNRKQELRRRVEDQTREIATLKKEKTKVGTSNTYILTYTKTTRLMLG